MWTCMKSKLSTSIEIGEVNALIRYAIENKKDKEGKVIPLLEAAKSEWEKSKDDPNNYNNMLKQYVALSAKTAPVSGRVLLDSENSSRYLFWLVASTLALIVVATADGILKLGLLDFPTPDEFRFLSKHGAAVTLDYIGPFVWGALGACVYLLKRLYDIASHQLFDAVLFRGWWVRLVLGAVLGGVVTQIFNFQPDETAAVAELNKTAVAFLTGLGVRVVYGAFERAVQILAEKMNLGQTPDTVKTKDGVMDARAILNKRLADTDPEAEPEKYKALLALLADLGEKKDTTESEQEK